MSSDTDRSFVHALSMLQEDWVYAFVFSQGAPNIAQQLKSAVSHSQPVLAELQLYVQPSLLPMAAVLNVDECFNLLFLPTFTSGSITVGFEVLDHTKISNSFTRVPRYMARFVRDDERGILLSIAEHPTLGITDVTFGILSSPGHRDHVLAQFHYKAFRKAMSNVQSGIDVALLRRGLTYSYYSVERRPCLTCREIIATGSTGCTCKLQLKRKIHPLDLAAEVHNMGLYGGSFRGTADLGVYSKGRCMFELKFVAFSEGRFNMDVNLQEELLAWALQQNLGSSSPGNSIVSVSDPDRGSYLLQHRNTCFPGALADKALSNNANTSASTLHMRQTSFVGGPHSKNDGGAALNISLSGQFCNNFASSAVELFPREDSVQDSLNGSTNTGYLSSSQDQDLCDWSCISAIAPRSTNNGGQDSLPRNAAVGTSQAGLSLGPILGSMPGSKSQEMPLRLSTCGKPSSVRRTSAQGMNLATIAVPSTVVDPNYVQPGKRLHPASPDMTGMNLSQRNGFLDETTRKRELRKTRNRESARRSGIKKNLKFQRLQDELGYAKKVEAELRSREQAMRRENFFLRTALELWAVRQIAPQ